VVSRVRPSKEELLPAMGSLQRRVHDLEGDPGR
jgi:hypothetical protein